MPESLEGSPDIEAHMSTHQPAHPLISNPLEATTMTLNTPLKINPPGFTDQRSVGLLVSLSFVLRSSARLVVLSLGSEWVAPSANGSPQPVAGKSSGKPLKTFLRVHCCSVRPSAVDGGSHRRNGRARGARKRPEAPRRRFPFRSVVAVAFLFRGGVGFSPRSKAVRTKKCHVSFQQSVRRTPKLSRRILGGWEGWLSLPQKEV